MRKALVMICLIAFAVGVIAIGGCGGSNPQEEVIGKFIDALKAGEPEKAEGYAYSKEDFIIVMADLGEVRKFLPGNTETEEGHKVGERILTADTRPGLIAEAEKKEGEKAKKVSLSTVSGALLMQDGEEIDSTFYLVEEGGDWKILFWYPEKGR